jgi:hypothetical protein
MTFIDPICSEKLGRIHTEATSIKQQGQAIGDMRYLSFVRSHQSNQIYNLWKCRWMKLPLHSRIFYNSHELNIVALQ